MAETPPLWLRLLSCRPVLYLVAGVLLPFAIVWLVALGALLLLEHAFHLVHLGGHLVGVQIPNPIAGAATVLSSGLYDAARGWFEEIQRRYGDGA